MPNEKTDSLDYCKRHKYRIVEQFPIEKKGPTGHPSGRYGIWQTRKCTVCGAPDGRYKPGFSAPSRFEAQQTINTL